MDDATLVGQSLRGEAEAFAALVRRYERRVFALAASGLGGPGRRADVEDCAQETFLAAYRGLGGLRDPSFFGGWLMGIARNQVRQALKRRRPMAGLPEDLAAPGSPEALGLLKLLSKLPESEREAVSLRHLGGLDPAEIARDLALAPGTVRSRISRGLERLRGILTQEGAS